MPLPTRRTIQANTPLLEAVARHLESAAASAIEAGDDPQLIEAFQTGASWANAIVENAQGAPKLCLRRGTLVMLTAFLDEAVASGHDDPGTAATIKRCQSAIEANLDCPA